MSHPTDLSPCTRPSNQSLLHTSAQVNPQSPKSQGCMLLLPQVPLPLHLPRPRRPTNLLDLLYPTPISNEKNIWFFWHTGYTNMHPYAQHNIRVLDRLPSSPLNVSNFLNTSDPGTFPCAFADGTIRGDYTAQHTSDLFRSPLLLKYGGVYADVVIQIGDLDRLWRETVGNPSSRFKVLSYDGGGTEGRSLTNYFLS